MADQYRNAKADAKAAKAAAKAMRPWFKKKRFMIPLGVFGLSVAAGLAGSGEDTPTTVSAGSDDTVAATAPAPTTDPGVRQGLGARDASDDVDVVKCGREQYLGPYADIAVTNNSSKASNYVIEIAFESPDKTRQLGTGAAFVSGLEPGQSKNEHVVSFDTSGGSGDFICRIASVQRNAAG